MIIKRKFYEVTADELKKGTNMLLEEASVTGTANIIMTAVLQKAKQQYIMPLVSHTSSNYVKC